MKLIIAEKPSVAKSIADVLGATTRHDGYFSGAGYAVTFAFGHLFSLFDAADYDPKYATWSVDNLPIIPETFKYKIHADAGVKKQFNIIKGLAANTSEIINACDSDREGSLIFAEIYRELGADAPIKRLWVSSHTPEDLKEGFARIRDGAADAPLTAAGYARQWTDWLLGINFTIAATKQFSRDGKMLNVGRVILPTMYLVYLRDMEIKNFIPKKYYVLSATFQAQQGVYTGLYLSGDNKVQFDDHKNLDSISNEVKGQPGEVISCATTRESKGPGKLFNLTDLQGHITSRFEGWTADKVLKCAQSLYEDKHITYPRTSSRYLDDSQKEPSKRVLEALKRLGPGIIPPELPFAWHDRQTVFDSSKVDSHPALIPTYLVPDLTSLSADEKIVYLEIVKRFLSQFAPLAEYDRTEAITRVKVHNFRTRARALVSPGWRLLYQDNGKLQDEDKKEEEEEPTLNFSLREKLPVVTKDLQTTGKETKPPVKYTVKTLLAAMQNCGKQVEDETLILKGYSIGTAATRADVLKKIEKIGYVSFTGKSYSVTALGIGLIEIYPIREMLEPDFTGRLEKQLKDIELGTLPQTAFMVVAREITILGIDKFKAVSGNVHREVKSLGKCPECGREIVETPKAYSCTGYQDKEKPCKFALWKEDNWFKSLGKKITATTAKGLLSGRAVLVKGMKSKAGKVFDAKVKLTKDGKRWKYAFEK
jgi:DNA topoisomerase-3